MIELKWSGQPIALDYIWINEEETNSVLKTMKSSSNVPTMINFQGVPREFK